MALRTLKQRSRPGTSAGSSRDDLLKTRRHASFPDQARAPHERSLAGEPLDAAEISADGIPEGKAATGREDFSPSCAPDPLAGPVAGASRHRRREPVVSGP